MSESRQLILSHLVRKIFLEDWGLKVVALLITLALWFGITGLSTPTTKRLTVPLNLGIASNAQIVNSPPPDVEIEITGDKTTIGQINRAEISAFIDLTDTAAGNWVVPLSPDNVFVALPQGVKLAEVAPTRIVVNIEAVEEKDLEVRAATVGRPPTGFEVYLVVGLPQRITVRGPSSIIKNLDEIATSPIDLTGHAQDFTARQIAVNTPDPKVVVLNPIVDVAFRIGERRIEREFSITVSGESGKTVSFTLFGPRSLVAKLRSEEIRAEMYLDGDGELTPRVILPPVIADRVEIRDVALP